MHGNEHKGSAGEVFAAFLALGVSSFGGPVAHLGYFRTAFVEKRRWLTDAAYSELVALCQFLPGPASSQVGIALGLGRAGCLGRARRLCRLHPAFGATARRLRLRAQHHRLADNRRADRAEARGPRRRGAGGSGHAAGSGARPFRAMLIAATGAAIALLVFPGGLQQLAAIALCGMHRRRGAAIREPPDRACGAGPVAAARRSAVGRVLRAALRPASARRADRR